MPSDYLQWNKRSKKEEKTNHENIFSNLRNPLDNWPVSKGTKFKPSLGQALYMNPDYQ